MKVIATMTTREGSSKIEFLKDDTNTKGTAQKNAYRWRVTSRNGEIIGASTEGFASMHNAKRNLSLLVLSVQEIAIQGWQAG